MKSVFPGGACGALPAALSLTALTPLLLFLEVALWSPNQVLKLPPSPLSSMTTPCSSVLSPDETSFPSPAPLPFHGQLLPQPSSCPLFLT